MIKELDSNDEVELLPGDGVIISAFIKPESQAVGWHCLIGDKLNLFDGGRYRIYEAPSSNAGSVFFYCGKAR